MNKYFLIVASYFVSFSSLSAQLNKPIIEPFNIGWGWFNLRISGTQIAPKAVEWQVIEKNLNQIVFSTSCDNTICSSNCLNGLFGDQKDTREKLIVGCKSNTTYTAKVRYNNAIEWSPWSESIDISTPIEPNYSGDEISILVWGNELVYFGDQCGIISTSRLGSQSLDSKDNFCYALQCDMRRVLNRKINIVNASYDGASIDSWLDIDKYKFDSIYASAYAMSLFFFGQESARKNIIATDYAKKLDSLSRFLASRQHHHIINSIHYTTDISKVSRKTQSDYAAAWNNKINTLESFEPDVAKYLWKGLDLYNLFRVDTLRYISPDGLHLDMTEGVPALVYRLAPYLFEIIDSTLTNTISTPPNKVSTYQKNNEILIHNSSINELLHYDLINLNGIKVQSGKISNSSITLNENISTGIYFLRLINNNSHVISQTKLFYNN